jgi:hypothetical protein
LESFTVMVIGLSGAPYLTALMARFQSALKFLGVPDTTNSIFLLQDETLAVYPSEFSDHHARDGRQITLVET